MGRDLTRKKNPPNKKVSGSIFLFPKKEAIMNSFSWLKDFVSLRKLQYKLSQLSHASHVKEKVHFLINKFQNSYRNI